MSIFIDENTKMIVQGFTGKIGSFHAQEMIKYGSNVVGGVTPGKGGTTHLDRPVFNTVKDAVKETGAEASILFVPPSYAADSAMEAADAGIKVIIFWIVIGRCSNNYKVSVCVSSSAIERSSKIKIAFS